MKIKCFLISSVLSMVLCCGLSMGADDVSTSSDPGTGNTVKKIPLIEAVEKGIQLDSLYKNRLLDTDIAGINREKARVKKLFHMDFGGSYLFKSEQMEITFPGVPAAVLPVSGITAGAKHNYDLKLAVAQPIFTGGMLSNAFKLEMEKQTSEKWNSLLRKIETTGSIKVSYFTFLLLESKKISLTLLIENLNLHLKKLSDFYDEDLVKKSDVLETKIKITETEISLEELNQLLEEERINFTRLCGFSVDDIEKDYRESIGSLQDSLAFFESHHPAIKIIDQNIRMLLLQKKIAAGSYLPAVNSFAELHYGRPGIDFFKNEWSVYFQGGLSIALKVFDWNQLKKDKTIIGLSLRQLNNRKEDMITEMKKKLTQLYARKNSLEKQLGTVDELVKFAAEDVDLKQELYKEQQVSNLDLLSALLSKERYESRQKELMLQVRFIDININTLIGGYGEERQK